MQKRDKIYVRYNRADKTTIDKFVSSHAAKLIFDNQEFDIVRRRITLYWYKRGIHALLPMYVRMLEYSWYSRWPHDPDDYQNVWETPAVRNAINQEGRYKSLARGISSQGGVKKQSGIQQYLPWIAIGLVLVVAFYFNQQIQGFASHLAVIENMQRAMAK